MWKLIVSVLFLLFEQTYCADSKCTDGTLVDVTFVFEYSNTIGTGGWNKEVQFVADVIKQYKLGPKDASVAAVTFATNSVRLFDLRNITDPSDAEKALKGNGNLNAQSYTDQVFNAIMGWNMFTNKVSGRTSAASYIVYIIDGSTTFLSRSTDAIKKLGVKFICIGIGFGGLSSELTDLSVPDQPFWVDSFESLNSLKSKIVDKTCPGKASVTTLAVPTTSIKTIPPVKAPVTTTAVPTTTIKTTTSARCSAYPEVMSKVDTALTHKECFTKCSSNRLCYSYAYNNGSRCDLALMSGAAIDTSNNELSVRATVSCVSKPDACPVYSYLSPMKSMNISHKDCFDSCVGNSTCYVYFYYKNSCNLSFLNGPIRDPNTNKATIGFVRCAML